MPLTFGPNGQPMKAQPSSNNPVSSPDGSGISELEQEWINAYNAAQQEGTTLLNYLAAASSNTLNSIAAQGASLLASLQAQKQLAMDRFLDENSVYEQQKLQNWQDNERMRKEMEVSKQKNRVGTRMFGSNPMETPPDTSPPTIKSRDDFLNDPRYANIAQSFDAQIANAMAEQENEAASAANQGSNSYNKAAQQLANQLAAINAQFGSSYTSAMGKKQKEDTEEMTKNLNSGGSEDWFDKNANINWDTPYTQPGWGGSTGWGSSAPNYGYQYAKGGITAEDELRYLLKRRGY